MDRCISTCGACANRLVWDHWKEFNGENTASKWEQTVEYSIPQMAPPLSTGTKTTAGWEKGTLADYMGIPTEVGPGASQTNPEYTVAELLLHHHDGSRKGHPLWNKAQEYPRHYREVKRSQR